MTMRLLPLFFCCSLLPVLTLSSAASNESEPSSGLSGPASLPSQATAPAGVSAAGLPSLPDNPSVPVSAHSLGAPSPILPVNIPVSDAPTPAQAGASSSAVRAPTATEDTAVPATPAVLAPTATEDSTAPATPAQPAKAADASIPAPGLPAEEGSFMCQDDTTPRPRREFTPHGKPSYWVTVSPDGSALSYMTGEGNEMIDVSEAGNGSTMKAPGLVDLQYSADQEYVTLVNKHTGYEKQRQFGVERGLSWYRSADLFKFFDTSLPRNPPVFDASQFPGQGRAIPRVAIDREFYNHYHSMGVFRDQAGKFWHRVINDYHGVSGRDYYWQNGVLEHGPVFALSSDGEVVDRYGNSYLDLPMLAKDSQYFGAYNRRTMTTQIFAIVNQQRQFMLDLGLETGKVAFSFREPESSTFYVAFHVDYVVHEEGNKVTGEMRGQSKDIMVIKLEEGHDSTGKPSLTKVGYAKVTQSQALGEGYYYPQWGRDGSLFFVAVTQNGAAYRFVKTDLKDFHFQPFNLPQKLSPYESTCGKQRFHALVALGGMWSKQCTNYAPRLKASEAALKALGLSERQCLALTRRWPQEEAALLRYDMFFTLQTPHNRGGRIRPDGRWTAKGEERRELVALREDLAALSVEDLIQACRDFKLSYEDICN